ncbi:hypothetical protein ILYODFUR_030716, partial [Ilyodon furcidens]
EERALQQVHVAAVGERREARRGQPVRLCSRGRRGGSWVTELQAGTFASQQADRCVRDLGNRDIVCRRFVTVSPVFNVTFGAVSNVF